MNCPRCNNEMVKLGKKFNFFTLLLVGLIIWPMLLFLPFVGMIKTKYKCNSCKKIYKETELSSKSNPV